MCCCVACTSRALAGPIQREKCKAPRIAQALADVRKEERERANHFLRCLDLKCQVCEEYRDLLDAVDNG